jgi:exosortase/archaeosortase family protein
LQGDAAQTVINLPSPKARGTFEGTHTAAARNKQKASMVSAQSYHPAARNSLLRIANELRRGEYFAGLFIIGCASGFATRVIHSIEEIGWADALFRTFGISVIVLASCVAGISLVLRDHTRGVRRLEIAVGAGFIILVIIPIAPLSWIAVTGLSFFILFSSDITTSRSGAIILLATTVPMLWSRILFQFFANFILAADALLVSWLLGTHRTGNMVEFADRSGQLVIFPACSSLANVSLAFLCWIALSQLVSHRKSSSDLLWCLLACSAVIAVNVIRMTILGLSDWHYAAFHNQWGDAIASVIILVLIVGISALGVRRELVQSI